MSASAKSSISNSVIALSLMIGIGVAFASDEPSANAERDEQRIVLFRPGAHEPPNVSASARADLDRNEFKREFLFMRWVQLNDIDADAAAPGDRVVFEISPGESIELVLSQVVVHPGDGGTFWFAGLPGYPASALNVIFVHRHGSASEQAIFRGAGLQIPGQGRLFEVITADDLPGWARLREIKPGSGTHLDNSGDTPSAAELEKMKRERQRLIDAETGKN
jgi:hypothetical protein